MSSNSYELSDIKDDYTSTSQTSLTPGQGKRNGGFYLSGPVALILVLLAAVVAVGVGIIVHFIGGGQNVVCNCPGSWAGNKPSAEVTKTECEKLASKGDTGVSSLSPAVTESPGTRHTNTEIPRVTDLRLPTSVYPLHYDVEIQPYMYHANPSDFTFKGFVRILIACRKATNNVTLHINVLKVQDSSIVFKSETPGTSETWSVVTAEDKDRQFLILKLDKDLEVGKKYVVEMNFTSPLHGNLFGLYYSSYTWDNRRIYLATTQFQPTHARDAFPCFDEPALKATFNITLVRPVDRVSISNTEMVSGPSITFQEGGITYAKDVYERTPKMSTYLLAFVVCDFNYTQSHTRDGKLFRVWAPPHLVDQTLYSLGVGVNIMNYFEDYFNVSYPMEKEDMISIPDFAAGAMENWGLITYKPKYLLYKDNITTETDKEMVAEIVSHELAHQWFGNLVTLAWWDDLWLNEGFASFVEYLGVDHVHPDWKTWETFVRSNIQESFDFDGLVTSHPVFAHVEHPDEIFEMFSSSQISYLKASSIVRMMSFFLGTETFRKGLHNYLVKLSFDVATHDDLWSALTEQAAADGKNLDVKEIMNTWIHQKNFPVVTVHRDFNIPNMLYVTQERYLADRSAEDNGKHNSTYGYKWNIPLTFTFSNKPRFNHTSADVYWLDKSESTKSIRLTEYVALSNHTNDWVLANVQQYGYYRVNYQLGNWQALSNQLKVNHSVISVINRAQLINDAWNLYKGGYIGIEVPLQVIEYLRNERQHVPWSATITELHFMRTMLALTPIYGAFEQFMVDTLNETFQEFGLINVREGHVDIAAQILFAEQSCYYGISSCLEQASSKFREWMQRPAVNPVNVNLRKEVYCYAIANGGWKEWKFALDKYKETDVNSEKSHLISAMACSRQAWILNHYMNLLLEVNSPIQYVDSHTVLSQVAHNSVGRDLAWTFFRSKFAYFNWYGQHYLPTLVSAVTDSFNTQLELTEVSAFIESEKEYFGSGEPAVLELIEKITNNVKWMTTNVPIITQWLAEKGYLRK